MSQMNMMYYFEKLRRKINNPSTEQLLKLIKRCIKLYQMIDSFINIFKLISKKDKLLLKNSDQLEIDKIEVRLQISINMLLLEHPVLPKRFKFKGMILNLDKEKDCNKV